MIKVAKKRPAFLPVILLILSVLVIVTSNVTTIYADDDRPHPEHEELFDEDNFADPTSAEGDKAMIKGINVFAGLVVTIGVVMLAIGVLNLIIGIGSQDPHRLTSAKLMIPVALALMMIVPIIKAFNFVK